MKVLIRDYKTEEPDIIEIEEFDVWNLDYTLAKIIHPALKLLKEVQQGAPVTDYTDAPEEFTPTKEQEVEWGADELHFDRWNWILDEMIWAFGEMASGARWNKIGADCKDYYSRINNATRLFGKYYTGLWD